VKGLFFVLERTNMDIKKLTERVDGWTRDSYALKKPPYSMRMLVSVRATHRHMLMMLNEMSAEIEKELDVADIKKTEDILQLNSRMMNLSRQYEVLANAIAEELDRQAQTKERTTT
jgi:hypothetical protein